MLRESASEYEVHLNATNVFSNTCAAQCMAVLNCMLV